MFVQIVELTRPGNKRGVIRSIREVGPFVFLNSPFLHTLAVESLGLGEGKPLSGMEVKLNARPPTKDD